MIYLEIVPRGPPPPLLSGLAWRRHLCNPRGTEAKKLVLSENIVLIYSLEKVINVV